MNDLVRKLLAYGIPLLLTGGMGGLFWHHSQQYSAEKQNPPQQQQRNIAPSLPSTGQGGGAGGSVSYGTTVASVNPDDASGAGDSTATPATEDASQPLAQLQLGEFAQFLSPKRVVQVLDAVALGERPVAPLKFLAPWNTFAAERSADGRLVVSAATARRFQKAIDAFCAISPDAAVAWFKVNESALQAALESLGYRGKDIRSMAAEAYQMILAVPEYPQEPELVPTGREGLYRYKDPAIEALNDFQKLALRLGQHNLKRIKEQCRNIHQAAAAVQ